MGKNILYGVVGIFILIQFFRPDWNTSNDHANDISTAYEVPEDVATILENKCRDCHSNFTDYPWYASIQPVGWWINGHIQEAKGSMNLSEYAAMPISNQYRRFDSIIRDVEEESMPIDEYTMMGAHPEAVWTEEEKQVVISWAEQQRTLLESQYPADTLDPPRNGPPGPPSGAGQ